MLRGKERSAPGPTYMSEEQKADYLRGLRSGHVSRPSGSRPPPPSKFLPRRTETESSVSAATNGRPSLQTSSSMPVMPAPKVNHARAESTPVARVRFAGRPLVREPSTTLPEVEQRSSTEEQPVQRKSSMSYIERGSRWMEKQEVHSLRMALEDMDLVEEKKVHSAAQDEAAELVWKHQNPDDLSAQPDAPYPNPDARRDYHSHLRKGSYRRSLSQDFAPIIAQRKTSGGSHDESINTSITSNKRRSVDVARKISPPSNSIVVEKKRTPSGKSYGGLAEAVADDIARAHRRSSSGSHRILSGEKKKMYMHPNDRIWEDPQEDQTLQPQVAIPPKPDAVAPPTHIRKNPFARVRMQAEKLERSRSEPIVTAPMHHSVEIQRNAPSQSRRPWYMSNEPLPPTPPSAGSQPADEVSPKVTPTKEGKELRGDDIRAATSKKRTDYSPKLPRPTVVSDKPGRPIVSFQKDWKPKEVVLEGVQAAPLSKAEAEPSKTRQPNDRFRNSPTTDSRPRMATVPQITVDESPKPPIPTINVPDEPAIPTIVLPEEPVFAEPSKITSAPATPSISVDPPAISIQPPSMNKSRPDRLPGRTQPSLRRSPPTAARPLPRHSATSPLPMSKSHITPVVRQSGTLCAQCALPIAGRILSAGGERFHPSCFVCHQCHTNLELVAFYPEPEKQSSERLARIAARQAGESFPNEDDLTEDEALQLEIEDGDSTPRFYCHLDFHELFSPRCKSCKTPIEGEVIVACGAEWHVGHFFCAQCGDPFDNKTPFVEKDGYAWCVGCHTNRYSSKCRKCRKPVTDTVVKALGHDWHSNCFVCTECNGEFQDGRYFLRGASQDPVCVMCEERRLKA